jgi:hypothetical protein
MKDLYYFAAWTDSDCLLGCDHQHNTVTSAVACISSVGGYVVAVAKGRLRELNDAEEAEFQLARYGGEQIREKTRVSDVLRIALEPLT